MPTQTRHTPTPWSVGRTLDTSYTRHWTPEEFALNDRRECQFIFARFSEEDEGRSRICVADCAVGLQNGEANARFIVRAVNSHAALVEALRETEAKLTAVARAFYVDGKRNALQAALSDWKTVAESARAVLATVEKGD